MWKLEQSHRLERRRTEDGSDTGAADPAVGILATEALKGFRTTEPEVSRSKHSSDCGDTAVVARSEDLDATRLYLNEIGFSPLLTADEEKHFSRLALAGDEPARQRMIESNLRLVVKIARRYINRGLPLLDLIEEGNIGLMHSVEKFDPELGYRFSTYATWWIRQTIERGIMNQTRTVRLPVHVAKTLNAYRRAARELEQHLNRQPSFEEIASRVKKPVADVRKTMSLMDRSTSIDEPLGVQSDLTLVDCIEDEQQSGPADLLQNDDVSVALSGWLTELTDKQREVVTRRFGLEDGEKCTLEEVGAQIGVTRERVRQIQIEALKQLRRMIDRDGLSADTLFQ